MYWSTDWINSKNQVVPVAGVHCERSYLGTFTVLWCIMTDHSNSHMKTSLVDRHPQSNWCVIYVIMLTNMCILEYFKCNSAARFRHLQLTMYKQGSSGDFCLDYKELFGVKFEKLCTVTYKLVHVIGTTLPDALMHNRITADNKLNSNQTCTRMTYTRCCHVNLKHHTSFG